MIDYPAVSGLSAGPPIGGCDQPQAHSNAAAALRLNA
jgi:hypothetical protein